MKTRFQKYSINSSAGMVILEKEISYSKNGVTASVSTAPGILFDSPKKARTKEEKLVLERHFNDLYAVFLHKLSAFVLNPEVSKEESQRLRTFFEELLKARDLLEE